MAKDGTIRGGARPRSGPKPSNQSDIETGMMGVFDFPEPDDLSAEFVPPIDDFLLETQKDGSKLEADKVFTSTYLWLKSRGCENLVPKQLINEYAMSVARWIQAERYVSKYGALAMHPTVKSPITSPYVTKNDLSEFMETLKANKHNLTSCQYQKLKTQALAGNYIDARKGLKKFLKRKFG